MLMLYYGRYQEQEQDQEDQNKRTQIQLNLYCMPKKPCPIFIVLLLYILFEKKVVILGLTCYLLA